MKKNSTTVFGKRDHPPVETVRLYPSQLLWGTIAVGTSLPLFQIFIDGFGGFEKRDAFAIAFSIAFFIYAVSQLIKPLTFLQFDQSGITRAGILGKKRIPWQLVKRSYIHSVALGGATTHHLMIEIVGEKTIRLWDNWQIDVEPLQEMIRRYLLVCQQPRKYRKPNWFQ